MLVVSMVATSRPSRQYACSNTPRIDSHTLQLQMQTQVMQVDSTEPCMTHLLLHEG
jgi:hypothetical protein